MAKKKAAAVVSEKTVDQNLETIRAVLRAGGSLIELADYLGHWQRFRFANLFFELKPPPPRAINPRRHLLKRERECIDDAKYYRPALNAIGNYRLLQREIRAVYKAVSGIEALLDATLVKDVWITLSMVDDILVGENDMTQAWCYLSNTSLEPRLRRLWVVKFIREKISRTDQICSHRLHENAARINEVASTLLTQRHHRKTPPNDIDANLLETVRGAVTSLGSDAKKVAVKKFVGKRAKDVFKALDHLKDAGEYQGPRG